MGKRELRNRELQRVDRNIQLGSVFNSSLEPEEYIIWFANAAEGVTWKERGVETVKCVFYALLIVVMLMLIIPALLHSGPFAILMLIFMIFMLTTAIAAQFKKMSSDYAITNKRVLFYNGNSVSAVNILEMFDIKVQTSERNIGSVTFRSISGLYKGGTKVKLGGIYGVEDPEEVSRILNKVSDDLRQGGRLNG